ncbi:MAG: response regulator transcription factor [Prevotella sp.]|nr:response regulator transcription factor [Prevotella sp.]
MKKIKILIVEDELGISRFLSEGLQEEGYETMTASDGAEGLTLFFSTHPDLVLLDWMLPSMDGIEVCNEIREEDTETPVIFLTARDTVAETITGLRAGANDYIKKPFSFEELLERIRIHFRNRQEDVIVSHGNVRVNVSARQVFVDKEKIQLTAREFDLLRYLMEHVGTVCTRDDIIRNVWGIKFQYDTGVIDVFMNSLRKKLSADRENGFIHTVRGVGFIIND